MCHAGQNFWWCVIFDLITSICHSRFVFLGSNTNKDSSLYISVSSSLLIVLRTRVIQLPTRELKESKQNINNELWKKDQKTLKILKTLKIYTGGYSAPIWTWSSALWLCWPSLQGSIIPKTATHLITWFKCMVWS